MKEQVRVLGIDDSPFTFKDGDSLVVGALVRVPNYLEAVMKTEVTVDGDDATQRLIEMVSGSRYLEQVKAIMVDGIALAGFNVIDIRALHESVKTPVITVTRDRPDLTQMRDALKKHFNDWEVRFDLVSRYPPRQMSTEHKPLFVSCLGIEWAEAERLLRASTVRGALPEPIRVAHLISAAMVKGESRGRS
jgi:endonuclease V-like protein UPF0215 family